MVDRKRFVLICNSALPNQTQPRPIIIIIIPSVLLFWSVEWQTHAANKDRCRKTILLWVSKPFPIRQASSEPTASLPNIRSQPQRPRQIASTRETPAQSAGRPPPNWQPDRQDRRFRDCPRRQQWCQSRGLGPVPFLSLPAVETEDLASPSFREPKESKSPHHLKKRCLPQW